MCFICSQELYSLYAMIKARHAALEQLKEVSPSLYLQATELQPSLFPFERSGITATPPIQNYVPPDVEDQLQLVLSKGYMYIGNVLKNITENILCSVLQFGGWISFEFLQYIFRKLTFKELSVTCLEFVTSSLEFLKEINTN